MDVTYRVRGAYNPAALRLLDFWPPDEYEPEDWADETWANALCLQATDLEQSYAPDLDAGYSFDNPWGFCCLILAKDLNDWLEAAKQIGSAVRDCGQPAPGHYGDGDWAGVDLIQLADGRLEWREL